MIPRYLKLVSPLYFAGSLGGYAVNCNRKYYRGILVRVESPDTGKISEDNTGELWTSTIFDPAAGHALGRSTLYLILYAVIFFLMESRSVTPCRVSQ